LKKYEFEPDPNKYDDSIYPEGLEKDTQSSGAINGWFGNQIS